MQSVLFSSNSVGVKVGSGLLTIDGLKDNKVDKERALLKFLRERDIFVTVRCSTGLGGVRVSFHYYTTKEEIDVFLDAVREFLAQ